MSKQTYWIANANGGAKALVEGADVRDRWVKVHGWTLTSEPGAQDRVWLQHNLTAGKQQFPSEVVESWGALGWLPTEPPEPVDLTKDPKLVDQADDTKDVKTSAGAASAVTENTDSASTGGTDKESSRG